MMWSFFVALSSFGEKTERRVLQQGRGLKSLLRIFPCARTSTGGDSCETFIFPISLYAAFDRSFRGFTQAVPVGKFRFISVFGLETAGCKAMAVSISRDLSVMVEDTTVRKLTDRQEALKESIQKGEPKVLGVSQVMVGVVVISYSLPLLASDFTEVVNFGVPWWSGTVFILTGAVAIATDKHSNMKFLCACLITTAIGLLVSILAVIFYFVDLHKNPDITPSKDCNPETDHCNIEHFVVAFSRGVKSSLLLFTIVQAIIASILSYNLYRERKRFNDYTAMNQLIPPSPTGATPIEFN